MEHKMGGSSPASPPLTTPLLINASLPAKLNIAAVPDQTYIMACMDSGRNSTHL